MSRLRAHYEPPHQNLCCLQIELFSSLEHKELVIDLRYNFQYLFSYFIEISSGKNEQA